MKTAFYIGDQFISYCNFPDEDEIFEFEITKPEPKGDALIPEYLKVHAHRRTEEIQENK